MQDLRNALNKSIVTFKFTKKNGTESTRRATRNLNSIPSENQPKGGSSKSPGLPFFDLDKKGWRSISPNSEYTIISIEQINTLETI